MKTITNDFKEAISKLGREIDLKFFLHTNDKIITENGKFLMTEDNRHLVVEQFDDTEVDEIINAEDIYATSIVTRGSLLSTMMKELDFEVSKDLRIGDVIGCQFGVKVNDAYEYIDYGNYMIYEKEFNEDTKTYSYVAFDRMLLTMQEVDSTIGGEFTTILDVIDYICDTVGLDKSELWTGRIVGQGVPPYVNLTKNIHLGTFDDLNITYRDMLDQICQALGLSMIVDGNKLKLKEIDRNIVDTIDEQYLKDTNVSFGEKYGPINSVVLSRSEDNDNIYRRDEESISENGLHEYKIKDNLIMLYDDREDYIDEIFEQLNGLEYYVNDLSSTGITYLDWLDFYNITIGNKTYKCLMLDDEIEISQGLEENIYSEMPEETVTNYKTSSKTDKEVSFIVDKQRGQIKGTVQKNNMIASLNLAIEDGQGIVELKGNSVTIDSDYFTLEADGSITASKGTFNGTLNTSQDCIIGNNLYVGQNQSSLIEDLKTISFSENTGLVRRNLLSSIESMEIISNSLLLKCYQQNSSTNYSPILQGDYSSAQLYGRNRTYITGGNSVSITGGEDSYNNITVSPNGINMSTQPTWPSDKRLKQEIKDIDTSWIDELKVKEFEYIKSPDKKHIGLIAQDYKEKDYAKYFLNKNEDGYYSIAYGNITNALIQYCQEMKKEINSLKEEIKQLKESDK